MDSTASSTTAGPRRLVRIPADEKIAGVCAGIADYLDVDVTLVRALWLALSIVPGAVIGGIVAYALLRGAARRRGLHREGRRRHARGRRDGRGAGTSPLARPSF